MKILYVITKSNWGGAQRHVYDLAVAMKEKGNEVAVALGGDGILRRRLEEANVSTRSIGSLKRDISAKQDASSFKEIFSIIKREKPDVLHLHSPKAAGLGSLAARILRVKNIVYTVHGWPFNEDRPIHQKAAIIFFSWLTILFAHKVILLSEREYAETLRFPWAKNKLALVPLGLKSPVFISIDGARQTLAKSTEMELPEFNKRFLIGTISELHPNKGLNYLVAAMEQVVADHPNAALLIIGDGDDKASLNLQIKEKKLEKSVFLLGYIENASEYLKALNLFVLASVKEGLPYCILEAACASLPVVATTVGGIPEMVEDMKTGVLVQPRNFRELSHAISFMIEHPNARRQYGAALREATVSKFSLEKMIADVYKIYGH